MSSTVNREFLYTRKDFDFLRELSNDKTGIIVTDDKFDMFYSRLSRRIRVLGLKDFESYCQYVSRSENKAEVIELVNAITTNLTAFFREKHHFDFFKSTAVPDVLSKKSGSRELNIWSAGCSTGEEPYSIAMTLGEMERVLAGVQPNILATDIDSAVVQTATNGVYTMERVTGLPASQLKRWFHKGKGAQEGKVRVRKELQQAIEFKLLNLMENWTLPPMDIIFCRNVIIYFDRETKQRLAEAFANTLAPGGYLFIGHSESLYRVSDRFHLLGNTVYQKVD